MSKNKPIKASPEESNSEPLFAGKVAIVTGASTGIGEAIAAKLFQMGASVALVSRNLKEVDAVAARLDEKGARTHAIEADIRDYKAVEKMIKETVKRFGGLHLAVNNAGITGPHEVTTADYEIEQWNDVIATDLSGTFFCLKYEIPAILKSGGGAIVNLSSANGIVGVAGISAYTAAKHGIIGLTQSAALEYAAQGIRINAIGPGYVDTPNMKKLPKKDRQMMAELHPMKRLATREEVAETAAFLLSEKSSFTTGSFYLMDGGYTAR
jgi:NAD(P)-dependent dehydrogenase (short-subunit alcohol dehydrogenase family)